VGFAHLEDAGLQKTECDDTAANADHRDAVADVNVRPRRIIR